MKRFEYEQIQMGVPVRVILYTDSEGNAISAANLAFAKFSELNALMSDYDSESELSLLCEKSTNFLTSCSENGWTKTSDDLFAVLKASKFYCVQSQGAFDITVGPMVRLWRRSRRQKKLPDQRHLDRVKELVGNNLWEIDERSQSVRLLKPGMKLDLGGIAKGYAIDQAFEVVRRQGITTFLIDAGGDIRAGDAPKSGWTVVLAKDGHPGKERSVSLRNSALASSGDASRFVVVDGIRYSHIIDPKTGLGLTRRILLYVSAPTAMEADAWASALSILGPEKGIPLIEAQKNVSAKIVLCEDGCEFQSKNWIDQ